MAEFLRTTPAQLVIWTTVLAILVAVGVYVVLRLRNHQRGEITSPSEMLTDFRELHDQGRLSRAEFQRVKSVLGEQVSEMPRADPSSNAERAD